MENYLTEAFKRLSLLEDNFDLSADKGVVDELKSFIADDIEAVEEEPIIDTNAEEASDLQDNYVGKVILECDCCHTRIYKDLADVIIDEETELANVDDVCPVCDGTFGYHIIGKIEEFDKDENFEKEDEEDEEVETEDAKETEDEDVKETEDEEIELEDEEIEEALNEVLYNKNSKSLKEADLKFVDNREAAILGRGDDYGFDEYDEVEDEVKVKSEFVKIFREVYDDPLERKVATMVYKKFMPDKWYTRNEWNAASKNVEKELKKLAKDEKYGSAAESILGDFYQSYDFDMMLNEYKDNEIDESLNEDANIVSAKDLDFASDDLPKDFNKEDIENLIEDLYRDEFPTLEFIVRSVEGPAGYPTIDIKGPEEAVVKWLKKYYDASNEDAKFYIYGESLKEDAEKKDYYEAYLNIRTNDPNMWGLDEEDEEWQEIKNHDGLRCKAYFSVDVNDEDLKSNYFDLEFEDGCTIDAVSGYELDFIDNESLNEKKACKGEKCKDKDLEEKCNESLSSDDLAINPETSVEHDQKLEDPEQDPIKEELKESDKPAATSIEDAQKWVDYDMKRYGKISGRTNRLVRKAGFQIIKDDHGDYEVAAGKFESLDEGIENLSLDTEDTHMEMKSDENGRVEVVTEPIKEKADFEKLEDEEEEVKSEDEMIAPLDVEEISEIEVNSDEAEKEDEENTDIKEIEEPAEEENEVDTDIDEIEEDSFDEMGESYLRKVYENVSGFKTTSVKDSGDSLIIEGLISFKSGNTKPTKFVFNDATISKKGDLVLKGMNETFSKSQRAFILRGKLVEGVFKPSSMIYNYNTKQLNESTNKQENIKVYGRVKSSKV